jgi:hypothetical protein
MRSLALMFAFPSCLYSRRIDHQSLLALPVFHHYRYRLLLIRTSYFEAQLGDYRHGFLP